MKPRVVGAAFATIALASTLCSAQEPFIIEHEEEQDAEPAPLPPPAMPAESPPPKPRPLPSVRGLAAGGASTGSLFGLSSTGLHLEAGFGVESGRLFVPIQANLDHGRTPAGIGLGDVTLSVGMQGILGRVRLGGGLDAGYGWFTRADSSSTPHVSMWAADAFALATLDLIRIGEKRAVYIGVKPSVGVRWGESAFALGRAEPTLRAAAMAGLRF